jgi:hypothetical protein
LPAGFESAIEAMITHSIASIEYESATLTFVITAYSIETNPTTRSLLPFCRKIAIDSVRDYTHISEYNRLITAGQPL